MIFKQAHPFKDILLSNKEPGEKYTQTWGKGITTEKFTKLFMSDKDLFSGYFHEGKKISFKQEDQILKKPLTGSFVSFHTLDEKIIARCDIFGLGLIYLYQYENLWAISNRYEMILDWAKSSGLPLTLKTDHITRGLTSIEQCFRQRHCRECDFEQVFLVPLDELVSIDTHGVNTSTNYFFTRLLEAERSEYNELINDAAEEIKNNTQAIFDCANYKNIICDLSGGFDSRLVFSAAISTGNAEKVIIRSNPVENSKDLEIATTIADSFKLKYLNKQYHPQSFISSVAALESAASYFMGEYFSYGTTAWSCEGGNNKTCRISGGGGELYRAVNLKQGNLSSTDPENFSGLATREIEGFELFNPSTGNPP